MINSRPSYAQGFTLIELLVVISIIGLLSSVVLASVKTARDKGQKAAGQRFEGYTYRAFGAEAYLNYDFDDGAIPPTDKSGNNIVLGCTTPPTAHSSPSSELIKGSALKLVPGQACLLNTTAPKKNFNSAAGSASIWVRPKVISANEGHVVYTRAFWLILQNGKATILSNGSPILSNSILPVNTWTHVLVSWKGANTQVYINGKLDASGGDMGVNSADAGSIYIGGWSASTDPTNAGVTFDGSIDQFMVYTQSIQSAAQAAEIYASELPAHTIAENR